MIVAELRALEAAIEAAALIPTSIGQVPDKTKPPYVALSGQWDPSRVALLPNGEDIDGRVTLTVTHTNEVNVHLAVQRIADAVNPDLHPTRLDVPGRYAVVVWHGMEGSVMPITQITYSETNTHPAFAKISLDIDSQPLG